MKKPPERSAARPAAQRLNVNKLIRDFEEEPGGSLWMFEDSTTGGLFHLMPK